MKLEEVAKKRRHFVNSEFKKSVSGTHMSNVDKRKLMKSLWKEAKQKIK